MSSESAAAAASSIVIAAGDKVFPDFMVLMTNEMSQQMIGDPKSNALARTLNHGLVFVMNAQNCAVGHRIVVKIMSRSALAKFQKDPRMKPEPLLTAYGKINKLEPSGDPGKSRLTIDITQVDQKEWRAFTNRADNVTADVNNKLRELKK